MEEKERYEYYKGTTEIFDNELDNIVEEVVDRLNTQDYNKRELLKVKQNQDQQIAELQKQLKETKVDLSLARNEIDTLKVNLTISLEHKKIIEEQYFENVKKLKSQPAEIVEKIRKQIFNHFNVNNMEEYESLSMLDSLFTADAVTDMLDDILKEYQKQKEKNYEKEKQKNI